MVFMGVFMGELRFSPDLRLVEAGRRVQAKVISTSMLPRLAFEYGQM
jgi:hypothetical protein